MYINKPPGYKSDSNIVHDRFLNFKREAYSSLNRALNLDQSSRSNQQQQQAGASQLDEVIFEYEKSLDIIQNALKLHDANLIALTQFNDVENIVRQLNGMKIQTQERLKTVKEQRLNQVNHRSITESIYPSLKKVKSIEELDQEEFLQIGDEILMNSNDDDCVIIEEEEFNLTTRKSTTLSPILMEKFKNEQKATELLRIDNGVQLFYIANDGTVSTPSYPTTLSFYLFDDNNKNNKFMINSQVVGFIRVGSWLYPLTPNESPAMKTEYNGYIFPNKDQDTLHDLNGKVNSFVGITFTKEISAETRSVFEDALLSYKCLLIQDKSRNQAVQLISKSSSTTSTSVINEMECVTDDDENWDKEKKKNDKEDDAEKMKKSNTVEYIAQNLISGAEYISNGVQKGTEMANKYIKDKSVQLKTQIQPNEKPTEIDPKVKKAAETLRYGTHVTVRVSSFLINKLGAFASYTAKTVAPHLKQGTTSLLHKSGIASKDNAHDYVENISTVAHSGLQSFTIVYDTLEDAAKVLGKNLTEETVTVVGHKYGEDAANVTKNSMYSVGNIAVSVNNVRNLKVVRTVAKATAKEALSSGRNKNVGEKIPQSDNQANVLSDSKSKIY